jgi:ABC-type multidrug transport system fused ATPase/permease subunit
MLSVIPPVGIGAVLYGRYLKKFSKKVQDELAKSSEVADERFNNIRSVRSFAQEGREIAKYEGKSKVQSPEITLEILMYDS